MGLCKDFQLSFSFGIIFNFFRRFSSAVAAATATAMATATASATAMATATAAAPCGTYQEQVSPVPPFGSPPRVEHRRPIILPSVYRTPGPFSESVI